MLLPRNAVGVDFAKVSGELTAAVLGVIKTMGVLNAGPAVIGASIGFLLFGLFFAGRIYGSGEYTISAAISQKYGRTTMTVVSLIMIYALLLVGTGAMFNAVPRGFIPVQDKLYLIAVVKLPEGASLGRTSEVTRQIVLDFMAKAGKTARPISDEEILERTVYAMVNEAAKILEEGVALRASDIDVIWIYGYGWPRHRGGPMHYADSIGLKVIRDRLREFEREFGDAFKPAALLDRLADEARHQAGPVGLHQLALLHHAEGAVDGG